MGDTKISYDEQFGIRTFKREICSELGEPFWLELTDGLVLPNMETEAGCKCCNMHTFICRLEAMADEMLAPVRHIARLRRNLFCPICRYLRFCVTAALVM